MVYRISSCTDVFSVSCLIRIHPSSFCLLFVTIRNSVPGTLRRSRGIAPSQKNLHHQGILPVQNLTPAQSGGQDVDVCQAASHLQAPSQSGGRAVKNCFTVFGRSDGRFNPTVPWKATHPARSCPDPQRLRCSLPPGRSGPDISPDASGHPPAGPCPQPSPSADSRLF